MSGSDFPSYPQKLLSKILPYDTKEEVLGDMEELYRQRKAANGEAYAKRRLFWDTLKSIRLMNTKEYSRENTQWILMLSYFRTGLRFLWKTRNYSSINILGLAFGITAACLAGLFITDQYSYDTFHSKIDRLHRLAMDLNFAGDVEKVGGSSYIMGWEFPEKISGIEMASRLMSGYGILIRDNENLEQRYHYADPPIFEMFDFEWERGSAEGFGDPNSVVVSADFYKKIGETDEVKLNLQGEDKTFKIIGVMKNMPMNSTFSPNLILPIQVWTTTVHERRTKTWLDINMNLIVLTREGANIDDINSQMTKMLAEGDPEMGLDQVDLYLQKFDKIHSDTSIYTGNGLNPTISEDILWVVIIVGFLCLIISSLNYSNFSIGHFLIRSREVGVRKILGARSHFVWQQFFFETLISSMIALLLAAVLMMLLLPYYSEFVAVPYGIHDLLKPKFLLGCLVIVLVSTFMSGTYPSLILARFKVVNTIKGAQKIGGRNIVSRIFLTSQIGLAIFLIIGTIAINQQLNYLLDFDLGYDDQRMVNIDLPDSEESEITRFRSYLSEIPGVAGFSVNSGFNGTRMTGDMKEKAGVVRHLHVDPGYVSFMGLDIIKGRDFDPELESDKTNAVIINETLRNILDDPNPLGKELPFSYGDLENPIVIGIVKDFFFKSPKYEQPPLVMYLSPQYPFQYGLIKMQENFSGKHFKQIEEAWNEVFYPNPFSYYWMEDLNERRMKAEVQIRNVALGGAVIAIMLVIFGLLSILGTYIQQRMKEIVIRKINGSSIRDLFFLFSKRFGTWLGLGFIFGAYPAYQVLQAWLEEYAIRIQMGYWMALVAFGVCVLVFVVTLVFQLLLAARVNPVMFLTEE